MLEPACINKIKPPYIFGQSGIVEFFYAIILKRERSDAVASEI